ncbi:glycerophosphodiester phosphodiesterase family protein [Agriterribacter sp.]|uniref:glycerophosphodiester phosphodiesterase family protein n=1 Tax=Agriterribacter sp. TaxID=2821509 RepID=UPI002C802913|nr:glycerophosphodiester phosphodiesterase family protein [Agriterribacter sp.]HRO45176.1 glycerophosphodiester phosphodiesterase family protein [Agriterribacter sp.]HRQ17781.1 glycerophosphodiester phosphodiesterase family protein [Agriterribacter sp.]
MRRTSLILFLLLSACFVFSQGKAPLPETKYKLAVIAHRGNHVKVPENTLESVKAAIKSGADYVELDLRTTKDGYLIIHHDATVDRMTNGTGNINNLTLAELQQLKVADKNKPTKKTYRIPTFSEVLKAAKGKINIYLDFKDAVVAETYRQIREAGMEKQVVVYVNKIPQYREWRKTAPGMPLITSVIEEVKNKEQLTFFLGQGTIEVLDNVYDREMVATANDNGVAVWLDVQSGDEGADDWNQALQKGIQGIQTDHPEALIAYLNKSGLRNGLGKDLTSEDPYTKYKKKTYRELKNIKYGKAPGDENMFDAYFPKDMQPNARVIVYIHGGGWTRGDKDEFPGQLIEELVGKRGYLVVSMNYRLVKNGQDRFPAQIEDVQKALEFISKNAGKYKYNGNEYALMGGSAGAHLAMLYAYGYDNAKQVKTVIDLWGPTDFTDKSVRPDGSDADKTVINFLGEKDENAQVAKDASPAYRLTKETGVPTILFHGGEDPLVNVSQAQNLYQKLQALGIPAQLEIYPGEKHGVGPAAAIDVFAKTFAWLENYYPSK